MDRVANLVELVKQWQELPLEMLQPFVKRTDLPGLGPAFSDLE
jgi:hypothetical protein